MTSLVSAAVLLALSAALSLSAAAASPLAEGEVGLSHQTHFQWRKYFLFKVAFRQFFFANIPLGFAAAAVAPSGLGVGQRSGYG